MYMYKYLCINIIHIYNIKTRQKYYLYRLYIYYRLPIMLDN